MTFQSDRITSIPAPLPTDYDRQYSFSNWEANNPGTPAPASAFEAEFNAIQQALDETQARLRLIQRDDGSLANGSVNVDQLASSLSIGVDPPENWTAFSSYTERQSVTYATGWYVCIETHIASNDFAADLAADKWQLILDFEGLVITEAEQWANTPEDTLVPSGDLVDDYSALHWAAKASGHATSAAASAAVFTGAVGTISPGDAGKLWEVNGTEDGFAVGPAVSDGPDADTLALRDAGGRVQGATPVAGDDLSNKTYVDGRTTIASQAEAEGLTNNTNLMTPLRVQQQIDIQTDVTATGDTIPVRDSGGRLEVASPTADTDAVNREYAKTLVGWARGLTVSATAVTGTWEVAAYLGGDNGYAVNLTFDSPDDEGVGDFFYIDFNATFADAWYALAPDVGGPGDFTILASSVTAGILGQNYLAPTAGQNGLTGTFTVHKLNLDSVGGLLKNIATISTGTLCVPNISTLTGSPGGVTGMAKTGSALLAVSPVGITGVPSGRSFVFETASGTDTAPTIVNLQAVRAT